MPVRKGKKRTEKSGSSVKKPVNPTEDVIKDLNLTFLPREYVERIDDIFDGFFNLGMPYSQVQRDIIDAPTFPRNMSSLSSGQLGDRLGEYTAWYSYISDRFKYIATATTYMEGELQKVQDRALGELITGGGNIETKKAKARSSEEYLTLQSYTAKFLLISMQIR